MKVELSRFCSLVGVKRIGNVIYLEKRQRLSTVVSQSGGILRNEIVTIGGGNRGHLTGQQAPNHLITAHIDCLITYVRNQSSE